MPTGEHRHKQLNARVPEETHAIIHYLQDEWRMTQARVLETIAFTAFNGDGRKLNGALRRYRNARSVQDDA
jgi:hypothetical protein